MDGQAHLIVSGLVQGVGFRYFAQRQADKQHLTGWIKNRSDGRVELTVEGDRGIIEDFIRELRIVHPYAKVTGIEIEWKPFTGGYPRFDIVY